MSRETTPLHWCPEADLTGLSVFPLGKSEVVLNTFENNISMH